MPIPKTLIDEAILSIVNIYLDVDRESPNRDQLEYELQHDEGQKLQIARLAIDEAIRRGMLIETIETHDSILIGVLDNEGFHRNDEKIDVEVLQATEKLWPVLETAKAGDPIDWPRFCDLVASYRSKSWLEHNAKERPAPIQENRGARPAVFSYSELVTWCQKLLPDVPDVTFPPYEEVSR